MLKYYSISVPQFYNECAFYIQYLLQEVFQLYTLNVAEKYGTWPLTVQYLASGRLISFNLPAGTGTNLSNVALTPGCFPEASM